MNIDNLKIIDFRRKFKNKFKDVRKFQLWKEFKDKLYFYTRDREGNLELYYFNKLDHEIYHKLSIKSEACQIALLFMDDYKLYYSAYDGMENIYELDLITYDSKLLVTTDSFDLKFLDSRYVILYKENRDTSLLDLEDGKTYLIEDERFRESFFDGSRIVFIGDSKYIVHCKYYMDIYDSELLHKDDMNSDISGIYFMEYDKFLYDIVVRKRAPRFETLVESDGDSYINPVIYSDYLFLEEMDYNYHFYIVNHSNKEFELYDIRMKKGELDKNLLKKFRFDEYKDSYNLIAHGFPVRIEKTTELGIENETRYFYPENYIYRSFLEENESLVHNLKDLIITSYWKRPDERTYVDGYKIRDKFSLDEILTINGHGILLEDGETFLIYDDYSLKVDSRILDSNKYTYTNMREVFENLNQLHLDYNWLISDFEFSSAGNPEIERLHDQEYLIFTGEELDRILKLEEIYWIWGFFAAIPKNYSKEDILAYSLPIADANEEFWKPDLNFQHPLSELEIVAWDSSLLLFITDNKTYMRDFDKVYPQAVDLNYHNRIIEYQLREIEDYLIKNYIIKDAGREGFHYRTIEVYNELYRSKYLNPYIKIEEQNILNLIRAIEEKKS